MKHKLEFLNPVFHQGFNTTVRLGDKWARKAKILDRVALVKTGREDKSLAEGVVTCLLYTTFYELPGWVLSHEHDPDCRTSPGLYLAMTRAYTTFDNASNVTVIGFEIDELEEPCFSPRTLMVGSTI